MKWYTLRARASRAKASAAGEAKPAEADLWIYADIGESWWDETVAAKDLVKEIAALDVDTINVRINSYGGSVTDGIAIYNALRRHPAQVKVSVDGIAASIASLVAMAGDEVEIAENARIMLHAPWGVAVGNAAELRERADQLDGWAKSMATAYARKTGRDVDDVLAVLTDGKDHWFGAEESVSEGYADRVVDAMPVMASASRMVWAAAAAAAKQNATAEKAKAVASPQESLAAPGAEPRNHQPAAGAAPLQENEPMTPEEKAAAEAKAKAEKEAAAAAAAADARKAEAQRQAEIRAAFEPHLAAEGAKALLDKCLANTELTLAEAKAALLDVKAKGVESVAGGHVVTMEDERDKRRTGMRAALEIRAGLGKNEGANPFRSYTLGEMARACLQAAGVRDVPGGKMEMIAMAFTHGTSDFPLLLANVAQKAMMKGYDEADETFQVWTTAGTLPDFKVQSTVDIGSFPALRKVAEGAEYKYITIGERREQRVLATYGERFAITRQAVINDDLDSFSRIPRKMGRAAIRTVGDLAYAVLTGNAAMADAIALFHASHGNLQGAATISTAAVDIMRVAMARQKDIGQTTGSLNIRMKYLLCPITIEGAAKVVRESEFEVGASTKNNTVPNSVRNSFEVVSDARLDDASTSIYYGMADPSMHDTVVVDYLDGQRTPTLEQQNGWAIDGAEFKVRIDASAKALDWKTMQRTG